MIRSIFSFVFIELGCVLFISCDTNEPEPGINNSYKNGVFIVNEGNYTDSDGSLSFLDLDSLKIHNKVFERINGRPFAGIFQSLTFYSGKGYMVDQLGRIEVVNQLDLQSEKTVTTDLDIPRWFTAFGSTGYVTDWGPYDDNYSSPDSKIKLFDLTDMSLIDELDTSPKPESVIIIDNKLYVANSEINVVSVYDIADNSLLKKIQVHYGPTQFVKDSDENLWVICTGAFISSGALEGIDTGSDKVFYTLDLTGKTPNGRLTIDGERSTLFFMSEDWAPDYSYAENIVYKIELNTNMMEPAMPDDPVEVVKGKNWYGLGADPSNDLLYIADAMAFQGNGKIYRYQFDGKLIDEYEVGRGPAGFVFPGRIQE